MRVTALNEIRNSMSWQQKGRKRKPKTPSQGVKLNNRGRNKNSLDEDVEQNWDTLYIETILAWIQYEEKQKTGKLQQSNTYRILVRILTENRLLEKHARLTGPD